MSDPGGRCGRRPRGGVSRTRNSGRKRERKHKVRATPFPTRLHHHPLQGRSGENAARTCSPGPGDPTPARAAQYRQLRREVLKTKVKSERRNVKAEKSSTSHSPTAHRCEQWNLHKQKSKCNIQHMKTNSPRKTENVQTESAFSNSSVHKPDKKPLASAENLQNLKLKEEIYTTEEIEKEINYAGAKFSEPPSPSVLPKPPSHWMGINGQHSDQCKELMTYHLKTLLKVQL
ncbi:proline-rich nuclear receptor coactivator 1 [Pseudophryne corroboree]|uniref:proline-rich nuclear receptor coactivator 1 n=1 Tax=Pseudophryne corroboree TaxID=495146 RepID=UPI003081F4DA